MTEGGVILCLNGGSSSLKFAAFRRQGGSEEKVLEGSVAPLSSSDALSAVFDRLSQTNLGAPVAVGHRLVHGGPRFRAPEKVTPSLLMSLAELQPYAPLHLPSELAAINAVAKRLPATPQVVCFDTAFHAGLPAVSKRFALPDRFNEEGIWRYGFHGLSYEYIVEHVGARALGKAVLAHLGSGASMAAVREGVSVDTTMGFTPTGGFMMGTRTGDLDPGVLFHLMRTKNLGAAELERLVNEDSGLLGVSGLSSDMASLLEKKNTHPRASLAIEMFCYQARKSVGAMAAALDGLDTLVFSGGIGEHAPEVRAAICSGLGHLGVNLDPKLNQVNAPIISSAESSAKVRVVATDEALIVAKHSRQLLEA